MQNLSETYRADLKLNAGEDLPPAVDAAALPDEWSWNFEESHNTPQLQQQPQEEKKRDQEFSSLDDMLSTVPSGQATPAGAQNNQAPVAAPRRSFGEDPSLLTDTDEVYQHQAAHGYQSSAHQAKSSLLPSVTASLDDVFSISPPTA